MGDSHNDALRVEFDCQNKREFHGPTIAATPDCSSSAISTTPPA